MSDIRGHSIGIVTGERKPGLTEGAQSLVAAFEARGATAEPVVWSREHDPGEYDVFLLRSCWDYHERIDAFRDWLADAEAAGASVLNPADVVRWNVHKSYLGDLADAGVPVLATEFIEQGADCSLASVLAARDWREAVVKPAVATSSAGAWRAFADNPDEDRFAAAVADGDVLVQRFAPEIRDGERSLVFLGGAFSHAFHRQPAADDWRAHPNFGADIAPYEPAAATVDGAAAALDAARGLFGAPPGELPYARVDGVLRDGEFRLMELELVEPHLGLASADGAPERLVDAIAAALSSVAKSP
jgi:glutathione synthase/RimK-type ligase-like ATP-grasp enzyme